MSRLLQDIRYGLRGMRKSPVTTVVAILSLALGIGANTAIFSFVNALILRMLPIEDPRALVFFGPATSSGNSDGFPDGSMSLFSYPIYREMAQKNQVFSGVAAVNSFNVNVYGIVDNSGNAEPLNIQLVSGTYFNVLGVKPVAGRAFLRSDDQIGAPPVALISAGFWKRKFGSAPDAIGKSLRLDGKGYTVVGVIPSDFDLMLDGFSASDIYVPVVQWNNDLLFNRGAGLGFHAACRYSLISPASLARRWIRAGGMRKAMTSGSSSGARRPMPSP